MGYGNVGSLDGGMPFLFPLERQESAVVQRVEHGADFRDGKLAICGQNWQPTLRMLVQVFHVYMSDEVAKGHSIFEWPFSVFEECGGRVPNDSDSRRVGQDRLHFGGARKIPMCLEPYLNSGSRKFFFEASQALADPRSRRRSILSRLNSVAEDANAGCAQPSGDFCHALTLPDPTLTFARLRRIESAACIHATDG